MSESEGFILKAEQYNQEEWCEMFRRVSETCKDLKIENECLQKELKEKDKEIERLNNIINELEEYIKPFLYMLNGITDRDIYEECQLEDFTMIMEKLQELKGDGK